MFNLFKRKPTASDIGKLGNAVKRERERQKVRDRCDEMRKAMGMDAAEWSK